jgi:hypothetical protein
MTQAVKVLYIAKAHRTDGREGPREKNHNITALAAKAIIGKGWQWRTIDRIVIVAIK